MRCVISTLATLAVAVIASDNSVHIYNSYPDLRITSSTLRWTGKRNGERPETAVVATFEVVPAEAESNVAARVDEGSVDAVKERPVHVCRARHDGMWVPGLLRTEATECQISLLGRVFSYSQYEVLENVDTGARLSWVQWGRSHLVLERGAVAGGEHYVARRRVDAGPHDEARILGPRHHVGHFAPKEGIGRVIVVVGSGKDAQEKEYHDGEILIEKEPVSYDVNSLKFLNKRRKEERLLRELGSAVLKNDQSDVTMKVDSVVAYDNMLSMYWGQGRAMLTGLPTKIRMPNDLSEDIKWGIPYTEERKDVYRVEAILEPGTAVNVTVYGNQTDSEVPYSGKLVAVYDDLQTRARSISGVQIEHFLKDLTAVYSPVYWLHNNSLVPTTTTTTTTTTSTTTTTTTTSTTTLRPRDTVEDNTVQGDDDKVHQAVALQKNVSLAGVNVPSSSSCLFHSAIVLVVASVLLRIT